MENRKWSARTLCRTKHATWQDDRDLINRKFCHEQKHGCKFVCQMPIPTGQGLLTLEHREEQIDQEEQIVQEQQVEGGDCKETKNSN